MWIPATSQSPTGYNINTSASVILSYELFNIIVAYPTVAIRSLLLRSNSRVSALFCQLLVRPSIFSQPPAGAPLLVVLPPTFEFFPMPFIIPHRQLGFYCCHCLLASVLLLPSYSLYLYLSLFPSTVDNSQKIQFYPFSKCYHPLCCLSSSLLNDILRVSFVLW